MNIEEARKKMQKTLDYFHDELGKIRGSRANPQLIEDLQVEAYGAKVPIKQIATVSVVDPTLMTIQSWDKTNVESIQRAVEEADLGVNPMVDGALIKVALPPMTEERRGELVKVIKKITEETKIAIRHIRRNILDQVEEEGLSEDEQERQKKEIQKIVDESNKNIDEEFNKKENELLTV